MHEALYYEKYNNTLVKCKLCPNYCLITEGNFGSCRSRKNVSGVLYAINYSRTVSLNIDPIEKKPLYHYHPGTKILSLGANSCNLHCQYCQNYDISQYDSLTEIIAPDELLDLTLRNNLHQLAFTYTEPFTWFEYILDCGKLLKKNNIKIVLVTNGYVNPEPLAELLPYIDAMNIDLKSIEEDFYTKTCLGRLNPVLETIKTAVQLCHVELTNLLIPDMNDKTQQIIDLVNFVYNINPDVPLHFSKYYPHWHSTQLPTPESKLLQAYDIAKDKLNNVYLGNIPIGSYSDTCCPNCSKLLIKRSAISIVINQIERNKCIACGKEIYGCFD